MDRVAVFIDHTNVHYLLRDLRKIDPIWPTFYNPLILSEKIAGMNRELFSVNFFCTQPPVTLLTSNEKDQEKYKNQMSYYSAVEKLDKVHIYYGKLTGGPGSYAEKDLDTQMVAQIISGAYENKFDTCVIVANDGDYASAVKILKTLKISTELLYFKGSCSMELRRIAGLSRRARRIFFQEMCI